jgi:hemerythrin superfamily protein
MNKSAPRSLTVDLTSPLSEFSLCHAGILAQLTALAGLAAPPDAGLHARETASGMLALFRGTVPDHHADEEKDLFPAVVRSASAGDERTRLQAMVDRLTTEHRVVEAIWEELEPAASALARGRPATLDSVVAADLVQRYLDHAAFEEQTFLPLAKTILGRNSEHMAELGLALHLRRASRPAGST